MTLDIERLKKLNAERTRGEWRKRRWPSESVGAGRTGITSDHGTIAIMSFPDEGDDHTNAAFITEAANQMDAILARLEEADRLEEALRPSEGTKIAYMGELLCDHQHEDDGPHLLPWTTIKDVMEMIRARATLKGEDNAR